MRLAPEQTRLILDLTHRRFGDQVSVTLFGSRVDDQARGGDIDLFMEFPSRPTIWHQAQLLAELENQLGLPVDLVVRGENEQEQPLHRIARLTGIKLT